MKVSVLVLLAFLSFTIDAQVNLEWNWVQSAIGKDGHTTINDTYTDASGNMYITGKFGSSAFKIDSDSVSIIDREAELVICIGYCPFSYKKDAFIVKLNNEGNVEWIQSIEGTESEEGIAITVNEIGEVWVLVNSNGDSITVDNNTLSLSSEKIWNSSSSIVKLKPNGDFDTMYQLADDDSYIKKAWINVVGDNLNIIGTFNKGGDGFIDIVGQKIPSNGRLGSSLSLFLNAETGTYVDFIWENQHWLLSRVIF